MALKKSSVVDILLVWLYQTTLAIIFMRFVLPAYAYEAQISQTMNGSPNSLKIVISYAVIGVATLLFRTIGKQKKASRFVILIQLLMIVVPFAVIYGCLNYPTWQVMLVLLGYSCTVLFVRVIPSIKLSLLSPMGSSLLIFFMGIIVLYVYVALVATGGLQRINFNLLKVYAVRADLSDHKFPLSGYFIPWVAYVLNMAALTYYMSMRKIAPIKTKIGVFIVMIMQSLLFGMTNFKAFIFLPFVIILLMLFLGKINLFRSAVLGVTAALVCLIALSLMGVAVGAGIVDRVFFVPPALHGLFFNYFSTHPLGLLQGTVGHLFGSTYDESIVTVVAKFYWGETFSPNVGWIGDAFANFGVIGVLVYALILAFALRLADGFVDGRIPDGVVEGLLFGFAFGITNAALLTSLLTGGYAVAVLALCVITSRWRRVPVEGSIALGVHS